MLDHSSDLLQKAGFARCPNPLHLSSPKGQAERTPDQSEFEGSRGWYQACPKRQILYSTTFTTEYGFAIVVENGQLCGPSIIRFPKYLGENNFKKAFERMVDFVEKAGEESISPGLNVWD